MKTKTGIYQIRNISNGKKYIGSAVNIPRRFNEHKKYLRANTHANIHLQRAWNKYGEVVFVFEVIEIVGDKKMLCEREQYWIDTTPDKYNIDLLAYSKLGTKMSDESKRKISSARMGRFTGKDNPFYGKRHSEESISQMKRTLSKLMSGQNNPFYGKRHTQETKSLLSEKLTGRRMPLSFIQKQIGNSRGALNYEITYPNGIRLHVQNLGKFCDDNELCRPNAYTAAASGKSYKGYRFVLLGS